MMNHSKSREYLHQMAENFTNDVTVPLVEKTETKFTDFSIARILELPTSCPSTVINTSSTQVQPEGRHFTCEDSSDFLSSWELMSDFDDSAEEFWNLPHRMTSAKFDEAELAAQASLTAARPSSETFTSFHLKNYRLESGSPIDLTDDPPESPPAHPENQDDSASSFGNATTESSCSSSGDATEELLSYSSTGDASSSPCHLNDVSCSFLSSDMHGPVNVAVISPERSQGFDNFAQDSVDPFAELDEVIVDFCKDLTCLKSQEDAVKSHEQPSTEMESSESLFESSANDIEDQIVMDEPEDAPTNLQAPSHGSFEVAQQSSSPHSSSECEPTETSSEPPIPFLNEVTNEMAEYALQDLNIIRRQIKVTKKKRVRFARGTKFTSSKSKKTLKKKPSKKTASSNRRATLLPGTRIEIENCSIEAEWKDQV